MRSFLLLYQQLHGAIKCKEIIVYLSTEKQTKPCQLLLQKWKTLKEIEFVLSIPLRATILLQRRDLNLSDVFSIWMKMQLHLTQLIEKKRDKLKTSLAKHMLTAVEARKEHIFTNPFMVAALYLDPRFRRVILADQIKSSEAISLLERVWARIDSHETANSPDKTTSFNSNSSGMSLDFNYDGDAELDKLLDGVQNEAQLVQNPTDITVILESFDPGHVKGQCAVQYWEENKNKQPELYKLAEIIYAIPPTEVEIEREFSQLNFVFTDRRCMLTEERLEDIMIVHLNSDLFEKVAAKELDEARVKFANYKSKSNTVKRLFD